MNRLVKTNTFPVLENSLDMLESLLNDSFLNTTSVPNRKIVSMKSDYFIEDNEVVLNIDVAGSTNEDVIVDFNKDTFTLTVKVAKQYEKKENKPRFYIRERVISDQSRAFYLPSDIDINSITADVKNGLLTVRAKKKELLQSEATVTIKVN